MIDLKKLKELVELMADQDLTELDLEDAEGEKVRLRRRGGQPETQYVSAPPPPPAAPPPAAGAPSAPPGGEAAPPAAEPARKTINSPMVGTFYAASSPDASAFVSVGDRVEPDTVVCIIEAMKVFNEIKAESAGTIKRVLVENGQSVEFDEPLFEIE